MAPDSFQSCGDAYPNPAKPEPNRGDRLSFGISIPAPEPDDERLCRIGTGSVLALLHIKDFAILRTRPAPYESSPRRMGRAKRNPSLPVPCVGMALVMKTLSSFMSRYCNGYVIGRNANASDITKGEDNMFSEI